MKKYEDEKSSLVFYTINQLFLDYHRFIYMILFFLKNIFMILITYEKLEKKENISRLSSSRKRINI